MGQGICGARVPPRLAPVVGNLAFPAQEALNLSPGPAHASSSSVPTVGQLYSWCVHP